MTALAARHKAIHSGGSKQGRDVGRKRSLPKFDADTPRRRFAHRLHALAERAGNPTYDHIAEIVGVTKLTVAKWFMGQNMPDLDHWPKLAKALKLADYRELLPPK